MTSINKTNSLLRFGSRGSALARWQTDRVARDLQRAWPDLTTETQFFSTKGDRSLDQPLPQIGGKGLFTAELEAALLAGEIDLAVHSLKDLPTENPPGLTIGAILVRENPADALVSRSGATLDSLPKGACIGTSSLRRAAQLRAYRPDLITQPIRGNVDTRIKKALDPDGPYEAIVLAWAGLARMDLTNHISQTLSFSLMLPAPGQGAIAVQCRAGDPLALAKLTPLNHEPTRQAVLAERAFLAALQGGCSVPVGALAQVEGARLHLEGLVADVSGTEVIRLNYEGQADQAGQIGRTLAQKAIAQGAAKILEAIHV